MVALDENRALIVFNNLAYVLERDSQRMREISNTGALRSQILPLNLVCRFPIHAFLVCTEKTLVLLTVSKHRLACYPIVKLPGLAEIMEYQGFRGNFPAVMRGSIFSCDFLKVDLGPVLVYLACMLEVEHSPEQQMVFKN